MQILHFQQEPTSSLLKLVPGSLPEGSQDQQILRGAAPHSCSSLAVTADAGASEHEMEDEAAKISTLCKQIQAHLPPIALLTTLTSGTPLCFLGWVSNNSEIQQ